MKTKDVEVFGR